MIRDVKIYSHLFLLLLILCTCAPAQKEKAPLPPQDLDQKIAEANRLCHQAQLEDAVIITSALLAQGGLNGQQEIAALLVLATAEASRDNTEMARAYLKRIAELNPAYELNSMEYPPQMTKIWYALEKDIPNRPKPQGQTIAVMYFDNASISEDHEQLEPLSKGLAAMMIQDIAKSGKIRVVERDRINFLLDELKLQQSDLADKGTAVQMGKLVGAQTILMGSFMKLDKSNFKIFGRLVSVETSEIIKAEEISGNPKDIFDLQKQLVIKILGDLNVEVGKDAENKIKQGRDSKYEALYHYSLGLALEEKHDYKGAYAEFEKALAISPGYAEAQQSKYRLEPLAMKG